MSKIDISGCSTVVGSFPYENTLENMEKAFWDQINAGVDYPCYPQLVEMVEQFLDPAVEWGCGIRKEGLEYYLDGEFKVPDENANIAIEYGEFVLKFLEEHPEVKDKIKGWKACLTGPFTLAGKIIIPEDMVDKKGFNIFSEPRAIQCAELVDKLAQMMANIAKKYDEMGATIISMDEPTLGLIIGRRGPMYHTNEIIIEKLNKAIAPISNYSSIHICGRIAPKLRDILLHSNVSIMDHEFQKSDNDGIFTKELLEKNNKLLAYGIIQSSIDWKNNAQVSDYIEDPVIVKERFENVYSEFGKENLILKPDCGFGGLLGQVGEKMGSEIVRQKLKQMNDIILFFNQKNKFVPNL